MIRSSTARTVLRYLVSALLLVTTWHGVIMLFAVPSYVLPSPSAVFSTLSSEWSWYANHSRTTLVNVMIGGTAGILAGVVVGMLCAYSRTLLWIVEPYLIIFQSFPRESLIPVVVVWLGFGAAPKIVNAALLSFFPMAVITLNSLLDTRSEYLELIRNWGASRWQEFLHCRLPYAAHSIAGGLKLAVPLALIGGVLGEFMGGNEGLGHIIVSSGANFRMDRSFAAIVILGTIGIVSLAAVRVLIDVGLGRFKQE